MGWHRPPDWRKLETEIWDEIADEAFNCGTQLFKAKNLNDPNLKIEDVRIYALKLLGRTLSNFQVVRLLLDRGYITEARAITRCCFENMFWINALRNKKETFVDEMEADHRKYAQRLTRRLLAAPSEEEIASGMVQSWEMVAKAIENTIIRPINHFEAARAGEVDAWYGEYSQLSADSAHPSIISLGRHASESDLDLMTGDTFTVRATAKTLEENEAGSTLGLAVKALMFVCHAAGAIIGGEDAEKLIDELYEGFDAVYDLEGEFARQELLRFIPQKPPTKNDRKIKKRRKAPRKKK
jgi:hypothetical protein